MPEFSLLINKALATIGTSLHCGMTAERRDRESDHRQGAQTDKMPSKSYTSDGHTMPHEASFLSSIRLHKERILKN
jgi:hypothetical protein